MTNPSYTAEAIPTDTHMNTAVMPTKEARFNYDTLSLSLQKKHTKSNKSFKSPCAITHRFPYWGEVVQVYKTVSPFFSFQFK